MLRSHSLELRQQEERLNSDAFFRAQREEADIYATERDNLLDQAQIAFDCNDLPAAKELSDQAKVQHELYVDANKVAADVIFATNNARVAKHEIDFHGLYLQETIEKLLERIDKDLENSATSLTIIYGQGERNDDLDTEREVIGAVTEVLRLRKLPYKIDDLSAQIKKCRVRYDEAARSDDPTDRSLDILLDIGDVEPTISAAAEPQLCCVIS